MSPLRSRRGNTDPSAPTSARSPIATPGNNDISSGAGNGAFGLGWSLDIPTIARKTETGLPRYADGDREDVFVLSGAEDLVPSRSLQAGEWIVDDAVEGAYVARR